MYNAFETYFESNILSAEPIELVRMLYRGAIEAVELARQFLHSGEIAARSKQITKAGLIVAELSRSVDRNAAPEIGQNLVELYDYMQRQLLQANMQQSDALLAEVSRLLTTLLEGWEQCGAPQNAAPAAPRYMEEPVQEETAQEELVGAGYSGGQSWSF